MRPVKQTIHSHPPAGLEREPEEKPTDFRDDLSLSSDYSAKSHEASSFEVFERSHPHPTFDPRKVPLDVRKGISGGVRMPEASTPIPKSTFGLFFRPSARSSLSTIEPTVSIGSLPSIVAGKTPPKLGC